MNKSKLTIEEKEIIVELYSKYKTIKTVSETTGYSVFIVSSTLREFGVEIESRQNRFRKLYPTAVDMYMGGEYSLEDIGRELKISPDHLSKKLKEDGMEIRTLFSKSKPIINQYSYDERIHMAMDLYREGKSLQYIKNNLGVHFHKNSVARKTFEKNGIEIVNQQNRTKFDDTVFEVINTEEKAYWLGFLYADGSVASHSKEKKNSNSVELGLQLGDIAHLEKYRNFLKLEREVKQDWFRCRVVFSNKKVRQDLINLGCTPRKSLTLTFPTEEQVPKHLQRHFIRGYVDGDGSVGIKTLNQKPFLNIMGTYEFLCSLRKVMGWRENAVSKQSNAYSIEYSGKSYLGSYLDSLYKDATIYLDRKYEKYLKIKEILPF